MWTFHGLLLISSAAILCGQTSCLPVIASAESSSSDSPRIYIAEIDSKYSGPTNDIINGWKGLDDVVSADEGIWTSSWIGEHLDLWPFHSPANASRPGKVFMTDNIGRMTCEPCSMHRMGPIRDSFTRFKKWMQCLLWQKSQETLYLRRA